MDWFICSSATLSFKKCILLLYSLLWLGSLYFSLFQESLGRLIPWALQILFAIGHSISIAILASWNCKKCLFFFFSISKVFRSFLLSSHCPSPAIICKDCDPLHNNSFSCSYLSLYVGVATHFFLPISLRNSISYSVVSISLVTLIVKICARNFQEQLSKMHVYPYCKSFVCSLVAFLYSNLNLSSNSSRNMAICYGFSPLVI